MCEHEFETIKEKLMLKDMLLGGKKRQMAYTLRCKKCGDLAFRIGPAGEDEK